MMHLATRCTLLAADNAVYAMPRMLAPGRPERAEGFRIYSDSLHLHGALALTLAADGNQICSSDTVVNATPAPAQ